MRRGTAIVAAAGAMWWWLRPFLVVVAGESMAPELVPDDYLVAVRRRQLRRGRLVVVEHPSRPGFEVVKRLTALPGDEADGGPLGPDQYWVTGDNSEESTDSRTFGPVFAHRIKGVVLARYWPPERLRAFR